MNETILSLLLSSLHLPNLLDAIENNVNNGTIGRGRGDGDVRVRDGYKGGGGNDEDDGRHAYNHHHHHPHAPSHPRPHQSSISGGTAGGGARSVEPTRHPMENKPTEDALVISLWSVFAVYGLITNLLILLGILRNCKLRSSTSYWLMMSLCLCDMSMIIICCAQLLPATALRGQYLSITSFSNAFGMFVYDSFWYTGVLHLLIMSLNRYVSICQSKLYLSLFSQRKTLIIIVGTYWMGIMVSLPNLFHCCWLIWDYNMYAARYVIEHTPYAYVDLTLNGVSMTIMLFSYSSIVCRVRKSRIIMERYKRLCRETGVGVGEGNKFSMDRNELAVVSRKEIRLFFQFAAVSLVFLLSLATWQWLPRVAASKWVGFVVTSLFFINNATNPTVYLLFNSILRKELRQLFCPFRSSADTYQSWAEMLQAGGIPNQERGIRLREVDAARGEHGGEMMCINPTVQVILSSTLNPSLSPATIQTSCSTPSPSVLSALGADRAASSKAAAAVLTPTAAVETTRTTTSAVVTPAVSNNSKRQTAVVSSSTSRGGATDQSAADSARATLQTVTELSSAEDAAASPPALRRAETETAVERLLQPPRSSSTPSPIITPSKSSTRAPFNIDTSEDSAALPPTFVSSPRAISSSREFIDRCHVRGTTYSAVPVYDGNARPVHEPSPTNRVQRKSPSIPTQTQRRFRSDRPPPMRTRRSWMLESPGSSRRRFVTSQSLCSSSSNSTTAADYYYCQSSVDDEEDEEDNDNRRTMMRMMIVGDNNNDTPRHHRQQKFGGGFNHHQRQLILQRGPLSQNSDSSSAETSQKMFSQQHEQHETRNSSMPDDIQGGHHQHPSPPSNRRMSPNFGHRSTAAAAGQQRQVPPGGLRGTRRILASLPSTHSQHCIGGDRKVSQCDTCASTALLARGFKIDTPSVQL